MQLTFFFGNVKIKEISFGFQSYDQFYPSKPSITFFVGFEALKGYVLSSKRYEICSSSGQKKYVFSIVFAICNIVQIIFFKIKSGFNRNILLCTV